MSTMYRHRVMSAAPLTPKIGKPLPTEERSGGAFYNSSGHQVDQRASLSARGGDGATRLRSPLRSANRSARNSITSEFPPCVATNGGGGVGGVNPYRPSKMYDPQRHSLCDRFSISDWMAANNSKFSTSERERAIAEQMRSEAMQTVEITRQRTRVRQNEATKKLGQRVQDIDYWKSELQKEMKLNPASSQLLKSSLDNLQQALNRTEEPQRIAEECLMHREKRQGIDLVNDDVEKNLQKEVSTIRRCQYKLRLCIEKASMQLKLNRSAYFDLEKDFSDKCHARNIDDKLENLRDNSQGVGLHSGADLNDLTQSIPESWIKFTQSNIARSQASRAASERLRNQMDDALRQCSNHMWSQFNVVNNSFNNRIHETLGARNQLQTHLQRSNNEIVDVQNSLARLRQALAEKDIPMKIARTRLDERTHRLNVELCNDAPMKTLQREVHEIRETMRALKNRIKVAEQQLARLQRTKSSLENEIAVKHNTLNIDQKICLNLRKAYPIDPNIGPIFNMPLGIS